MCGHAGLIIGNPSDFFAEQNYRITSSARSASASSIAAVLLQEAQSFRGGDGFGVMALSKSSLIDSVVDGELGVSFVKKVDPFNGIWSSVIDNTKIFEESGVICMHARKMTAGQKVFAATHPIHVDNITLMHNGSVPDWSRLFPKAASDTIGLAQMLAEKGIKPIAEDIVGAKTLVWLDADDNTLNIFKHKDRPLYMCRTGSSYIYASEKWMVFKALDQYNLPQNEWIDFKDQYHYKYDVATGTWSEPAHYEEPVERNYYSSYNSKKNAQTTTTDIVQTGATGAENVKNGLSVTETPRSSVVITKGTKLIVRLLSITQYGTHSVLEGRISYSHDHCPPTVFIGKLVKMRIPTRLYNAFATAVNAGVYVATATSTPCSNSIEEINCDMPHSMAILFDTGMVKNDYDRLADAADKLFAATSKSDMPESFPVSARNFLEWLDAFELNNNEVFGVTFVDNPKRLHSKVPNKQINIPCV